MPAPKKTDKERRTIVLRVRVNQDERGTLEKAAAKAGTELTTWVRELALKAAQRTLAKEA